MSFPVRSRPLPPKRKPPRGAVAAKRRKPISTSKCKRCNSTPLALRAQEFPSIWEELRANNQLCDGVVKCEDHVQFNIHRIILSSISPYFRALFTNSINRGRQEVRVANVNISSRAFKVILDFAYTGSCVLDQSNVFEVLKYADQYEIMDVVQNCCQFLVRDLSPTNCLQVLKFAHQFHCQALATKAHMFLLQNFSDVLKLNSHFGSIPPQHLQEILTSDYLNVKSEEVVVQAVQLWIGESGARSAHLFELLKCVRMGCMSADKLMKIARLPLIEEDTSCSLLIADVLTIMEDLEGDSLDTYLTRPRIPYDILFAIGGWSAGSPTSFVETYDNRADRWLVSKDTDIVARAYHGICSFGEKIYLVGGFDGNEYFNTVRCFDPATHSWSDCACMYYSRCYVSVVECLGKIYAMGGYNGRIRMSSAERFDPLRNQWELLPAMQRQRSDASAATLNHKVYIVGGFNGQEVINSAEMYDPLTNQWSFIPPMGSARSGVSLIAHHNALYAIGGFNGTTRLPSTEKFIPDTSAWMDMADMMTPRSNFGTVVLDDCIYVIGGFNGSTTINYVEYFDLETGEWMDAASMNLNRSALSACVISGLPNSKDYSFLDRSQRRQNKEANDGV